MLQAPRRGLDVDQLHSSQTPAWRNLRGRGERQLKRASYYEGDADADDEIADQRSDDDDEELGADEEAAGSSSEVRRGLAEICRLTAGAGPYFKSC